MHTTQRSLPLRGRQNIASRRAAASIVESLEQRFLLAQIAPPFALGQMQADPARDLVYLIDATDNRVLAIDTTAAKTASFADVGGKPTALAISPDDKELYVSAFSANRIEVYSLPELLPVRTLDVSTPGRLAVGAGNRLYVAGNSQWAGMRQVDANTGAVLRSFGSFYSPLPVTDSTGTRLFVSELGLSTTGTDEYNISDPNNTPVGVKSWSTNMANGRDFAIDEQYNRLYSMSGGVYGVYVVDQATGVGTKWSFVTAAYGSGVAFTAGLPYVWATSGDPYSGGVFQFNRDTGAVISRYVPSGTYAEAVDVEATPNGRVMYTAQPNVSGPLNIGIIGAASLTLTGIPMARFNWNVDTFPSLKVSFDGAPSRDWDAIGTVSNWAWNFGDGTTGTGRTIDHTFAGSGKYQVRLTVTDNQGNKDDYLVTVNLTNPPVAQSQSLTLDEDSSKTFTLSGSDPDGDPISFIVKTPPTHGKIQQNGATVTYTPFADFFGSDSLVFAASDGGRQSAGATISFTVNNLPDAPVARDDVVPMAAGPQTLILPLLNDADVDGDALSITAFTQPGAGSVLRQGNRFLYTPATGASAATDSFACTISDPGGLTSTAKVYISPGYAQLSGEWNTFGNSAAHAGYFAGTVGNALPVGSWSLPASTSNGGPIAVGGGRVYVTDSDNDGFLLKALDPSSGATLWTHRFEGGFSLNPPTYYNGVVYLQRGNHSSDTQLWAINAATGATVWSAPFAAQWENYYAPAVSSQGIWINGGYYGGMYGFNFNGTQIKFVGLAQYDQWTPSILGNNVYSYVAGAFTKYDMSGNALWTNSKAWNWSGWSMGRTSALIDNQAFLIGNPDLYSVNLTTGATAWTVPGNFVGTPAASGGVVFAISGSAVKSYSAADGAALVSYAADQPLREQPIVTDDAVIAASSAKTYIFSRSNGSLLYTIAFGGRIALSNNRLYISSGDGSLHTYVFTQPTPTPLDAGGPYAVEDGNSITLAPLVTPPAGVNIDSYDIDWNYDGANFTADANTTSVPVFSTIGMNGPDTRMIAFRAHFSTGDLSNISSTSLQVLYPAPAVSSAEFQFETAQRLHFVFTGNAQLQADSVVIRNLTTKQTIAADSFTFARTGSGTIDVVWTSGARLPDGNYTATLAANSVTNRIDVAMAQPYVLNFFVLTGDLNRDRQVTISDFIDLAGNFDTSGTTYSTGDLNYDGQTTIADFSDLAANFGASLPEESVTAQPAAAIELTSAAPASTAELLQKNQKRTPHRRISVVAHRRTIAHHRRHRH